MEKKKLRRIKKHSRKVSKELKQISDVLDVYAPEGTDKLREGCYTKVDNEDFIKLIQYAVSASLSAHIIKGYLREEDRMKAEKQARSGYLHVKDEITTGGNVMYGPQYPGPTNPPNPNDFRNYEQSPGKVRLSVTPEADDVTKTKNNIITVNLWADWLRAVGKDQNVMCIKFDFDGEVKFTLEPRA